MSVETPIRTMQEMQARRSLVHQVGGQGFPGVSELPRDLDRITQIPDQEIMDWTDEYLTRKYNYDLTIQHIREITGKVSV